MLTINSIRCIINIVTRVAGEVFTLSKSGVVERVHLFSTFENRKFTVQNVFNEWLTKFETDGVNEPKESMNIIMAHVLGIKKVDENHFYNKRCLSDVQVELLNRLCECRLARMPVQYIIGEWQFRNLCLALSPPVFIPRPETETLVELVLERVNQNSGFVEILEIGCGSGAISLSLAQESPKVNCTAIDQSELACRIAKKNALSHKLDGRVKIAWAKLTEEGNICKGQLEDTLREELPRKFDIVVSNPPYVPQRDIFHLQPEILLYEDLRALDGGKDGLKIVKPLLKMAADVLEPPKDEKAGGTVFIEVDPSHPALLEKWLISQGKMLPLMIKKVHHDLFGKERFVELIKI